MPRVRLMWQQVSNLVFVRRYEFLDQTIPVIVTDDACAVVDSRSNHVDGSELLADVRSLTAAPVRWLINTHYHWDHAFGNAMFEGATIVGTEACRTALVTDGSSRLAKLQSAEWLPEERRPDFDDVRIVPPTETFIDGLALPLGDETIQLWHPGRGHTDSDLVCMVDGVVLAGDLVEVGAPPAFGDSFPREWVDTLDRVSQEVGGPVVPGHGDVANGAFVQGQRDEIGAAIAHIDTGDGVSPYGDAVTQQIRERLEIT